MSFLILAGRYNKLLKTIMVDKVEVDAVPSLVFKTMQGSIGVLLSYKAIQTFNVSTVGIATSIAPLLVFLLAYLMLGEKITPI